VGAMPKEQNIPKKRACSLEVPVEVLHPCPCIADSSAHTEGIMTFS